MSGKWKAGDIVTESYPCGLPVWKILCAPSDMHPSRVDSIRKATSEDIDRWLEVYLLRIRDIEASMRQLIELQKEILSVEGEQSATNKKGGES